MTPRLPLPRTAAHRAGVLALLLAFVLAQSLGWIHRGLHGATGAFTTSAASAHALAVAPATVQAGSAFAGLFGSHADASDCRLFDAVAQPGCTPAGVVLADLAFPAALFAAAHGDFVARWRALFDARGPPLSR